MSVVSRTREERILIMPRNGERGIAEAGLGECCLMRHGVVEVGDGTLKMDPWASRNSGDGSIESGEGTVESTQSKYSA